MEKEQTIFDKARLNRAELELKFSKLKEETCEMF